MGANPRTKGASGEREVAKKLNAIVDQVHLKYGLPITTIQDEPFQRNQNQSAVGGDDLTNPFGLSIEVKRQESLSINAWWGQTINSAARFGNIPILIFKQNRKKWRVIMIVEIDLNNKNDGAHQINTLTSRAEIDIETFELWFTSFYTGWLKTNGVISTA